VLAIAGIAVAVYANGKSVSDHDGWSDITSAAIDLVVVVALGGFATFLLERWKQAGEDRVRQEQTAAARRAEKLKKDADARAEVRRQEAWDREQEADRLARDRAFAEQARAARNVVQSQVLRELLDNYNRVKAVRRRLRALGIGALSDGVKFDDGIVDTYRRLMLDLSEAELGIEAQCNYVAQTVPFTDSDAIVEQLKIVENYLNQGLPGSDGEARGVLIEWQTVDSQINDADAGRLKALLPSLLEFLEFEKDETAPFDLYVLDPVRQVLQIATGELLASATPDDAPSTIDADRDDVFDSALTAGFAV
jgi:hypothetical protein